MKRPAAGGSTLTCHTKKKFQRTEGGSGLVECPFCFRQVPLASINVHLDTEHSGGQPPARAPSRTRTGRLEHTTREPGRSLSVSVDTSGSKFRKRIVQTSDNQLQQESFSTVRERFLVRAHQPSPSLLGARPAVLSSAEESTSALRAGCTASGVAPTQSGNSLQGNTHERLEGTAAIDAASRHIELPNSKSTCRRPDLPLQQPDKGERLACRLECRQSTALPDDETEGVAASSAECGEQLGQHLLLQGGSAGDDSRPQESPSLQQASERIQGQQPSNEFSEAVVVPRTMAAKPGESAVAKLMLSSAKPKLAGQYLFERFVSEAEESELVAMIDRVAPAWKNSTFNGRHRGKAWGVKMNLARRTVAPESHPLPPLLQNLAIRMRTLPPLRSFFPTEANAIEYDRASGHYLGAHIDNRQLSTGAIVTLSLLSQCVMTFERDTSSARAMAVDVTLPHGSLQVITGEARYSYKHGIALSNFQGARRVSVTFRQSPLRR